MRVERSAVNDQTEYYLDEYIMRGSGEEIWEESFTYKAFRYIELTFSDKVELLSIEVCKAGTDAPCEGSFHCDNPAVNAMVCACIETQKNGILGLLADCPHREQAEYLGDSLMQSHLLTYNFPEARVLLRKVLRDFADNQLTEGYFPFVAPIDWVPDGPFELRMPEYDLRYTEILWTLRWDFDDLESVREFYPIAAKNEAYFLTLRDNSGLIPNIQKATMHISDWPYPTIDEEGDYLFVLNAYSLQTLGRLEKLSELLCLESDQVYWMQEYGRTASALRKYFFDDKVGLYKDTTVSTKHHVGVNTLAFELGLFRKDEQSAVINFLKNAPYETSVILSWNYLRMLFQNDDKEKAFRLLTDSSARWGRMIAEGSKTIWEGFEDIESHSHAWNCYPTRLFQEFILGISSTEPSFRRIAIVPFFPQGIEEISGRIWTTQGIVELCGWRSGKFKLTLPETVIADFTYGKLNVTFHGGIHLFQAEME